RLGRASLRRCGGDGRVGPDSSGRGPDIPLPRGRDECQGPHGRPRPDGAGMRRAVVLLAALALVPAAAAAPPPPAAALQNQLVSVVKRVAPSVVQIEAAGSLGSGV